MLPWEGWRQHHDRDRTGGENGFGKTDGHGLSDVTDALVE